MHGYLARRIPPLSSSAGTEREQAIAALREFYEAEFLELTQEGSKTKLTSWILLQAQAEATRISNDPNTLT